MLDPLVSSLAQVSWALFGLIALAGVVIAHIVGYGFARTLALRPGHARDVMPSLPVAPMQEGRAAVRFQRSVVRAESVLLREFVDGARGVEATALAAAVQIDPLIVSAALERIREEIPCRLRITASGKILHDFAPSDVSKLRQKRRLWLPVRMLVFVLAGLANIGAIWPVLLILGIAVWTLNVAATGTSETAVPLGVQGLASIGIALVATLGIGWLMHFVLTPLLSAPRLGGTDEAMVFPHHASTGLRKSEGRRDSGWLWFGHDWSWGARGTSSGWSSGDSDGGDGGSAQALIIVIALVVIVLCTAALFVWVRGLWRAISRDDRELDRMSPALWVRVGATVDRFERYIPTNDLVGRVYGALERVHSHRRPVDERLGARVVGLAARGRGRVSAIDIALEEGFDLSEATEVGSRLTALVGGEILVSDAGDIAFEFPRSIVSDFDPRSIDGETWAEYLTLEPLIERIRRRALQEKTGVPVNLVGLTYGHLVATDRLVGGTLLMAISGTILLSHPELLGTWLPKYSTIISTLLFAFATGAMALSAAARYTARATAIHGVHRDVRRACFGVIRDAIAFGNRRVDLTELPVWLRHVFLAAWSDISEDDIAKEVHAVLVDLDLGPSLEAGGRLVVELDDLHRRLASARNTGSSLFEGAPSRATLDDSIVFETEITHDRVKVLA